MLLWLLQRSLDCYAFERMGIADKLFLRKRFQTLKLRDGASVQTYLLQFEKVLRELSAAGTAAVYKALITALEMIQPNQLTLEYVKKTAVG